MVTKNVDEGTMICDSAVIMGGGNARVQIPKLVIELLNLKMGDRFRWYLKKRDENYLKISAVFIDKTNHKFVYPKKADTI